MRTGLSLLALVGASVLSPSSATADVQHVIARGHTIEAIANRYRVSSKSIIEANHLTDVKRLKVGDVLTIPKAESHDKKDAKKDPKKDDGKAKLAGKDRDARTAAASYVAKPKTPGVVHVRRLGSTEEVDLKITDGSGRVAPATIRSFESILRSPNGASHPIDPRLISLLGLVSNHFGSRRIEVVSGFRPYSPTQYTHHSNHNHGKAIDFRVAGVPNEVVRDYCRTLRNVGCGYYPNSTFVHLDVRESSAFWIDYSRPGEPPRYNAANVQADEGTSDVHGAGGRPSANTPAPEPHAAAPTPPSPPPPAEGDSDTDSGD